MSRSDNADVADDILSPAHIGGPALIDLMEWRSVVGAEDIIDVISKFSLFHLIFFYFILGIITSCHFA